AVREAAELRFPQNRRVLRFDGVAVLETETGVLRKRAVVVLERRGRAGKLLNRRVAIAGIDVVQHEMPLAEGTALGILSGQTNGRALAQQRRERQRLRVCPLDAFLGGESAAALQLLVELRMNREAVRHREQGVVEGGEAVRVHGGRRL